eukprot:1705709-Rhodomonas_salina.1
MARSRTISERTSRCSEVQIYPQTALQIQLNCCRASLPQTLPGNTLGYGAMVLCGTELAYGATRRETSGGTQCAPQPRTLAPYPRRRRYYQRPIALHTRPTALCTRPGCPMHTVYAHAM